MIKQLELGTYIFDGAYYIWDKRYYEAIVLTISPSGKMAKVRYASGITQWVDIKELKPIEKLN